MYGPTQDISREMDRLKYCTKNESFDDKVIRIANALKDSAQHFDEFRDVLRNMRFLPAGRVQAAMGSPRMVTGFNCFVSRTIEDSMDGIMDAAKEAAETMRRGGGIGFDFSTLRPRGDLIVSLDSRSSGPISFMNIYDSVCQTIASAGHRRGAMMAVLRIDHPDAPAFVRAKQNSDKLNGFNVSLAVTDEFMRAMKDGQPFPLKFQGRVYDMIDPRSLWEDIMRANWNYAEPGVLFIDTINRMNNLWYCENIAATNPCAEQPLPPYGACLLGSFNLTAYLSKDEQGKPSFDWRQLGDDIHPVVRAMDNVIDRTTFPLPQQAAEAKGKRRIGLGVTGLANCAEVLGMTYGGPSFLMFERQTLDFIRNNTYSASASLANEKGSFPMYDEEKYLRGRFVRALPEEIKERIEQFGIRNSHLTSIAPAGTISLVADNVSSGIEPPFAHSYERTLQTFDGPKTVKVEDWAYRVHGIRGKTSRQCSAEDHVKVLTHAAPYVDSAISKTCNVDQLMPWEDFLDLYTRAWEGGAKGLTVFNPAGKRAGVLSEDKNEEGATACQADPETGIKECA